MTRIYFWEQGHSAKAPISNIPSCGFNPQDFSFCILDGYTKLTQSGAYFLGELVFDSEYKQIASLLDFPGRWQETLLTELHLALCDYNSWSYASEGLPRKEAQALAEAFSNPEFDFLSKDIQALDRRFYRLEARAGIECIYLDIQELGHEGTMAGLNEREQGHYVLWATSKAFGAWVKEQLEMETESQSQDNETNPQEGGL